ncbi:MAG: hypothetical protein A2539_10530 [Elusimicrobia bacterium RIFOXYD2_FULL_34_15]|nr:MAG: hypothetical protein A2539_10530 [Elusimicrobia bacterium RIFOXYD2_FULL_34_15]
MEENILIEKAIGGDVSAFEQLLSNYQTKIYNIAYYLSGNEFDAKDLLQEIMLKVFKSLKSFRGDSSFSRWLWQIAHNTFLDDCKKSYKKNLSLTDSLDSIEWFISDNSSPLEDAEKSYLKKQVDDVLLKIPPKYRLVIVMCDMQGFSYSEIAEINKCSIGTVKSRLNRGRYMLRKKIKISGTFYKD